MKRLFAVLAVLCAAKGFAASEPVLVHTAPLHNRLWMTVVSNEGPLSWAWPPDAHSAVLTLTGKYANETVAFDGVTTDWTWRPTDAPDVARDDVVDLLLTFRGAGDEPVGALAARLAVVAGAFRPVLVMPDASAPDWTRVKEDVVIGYDAAWQDTARSASGSRLVVVRPDGNPVTNMTADVSGFSLWRVKSEKWGFGAFTLALDFPGGEGGWESTLTRLPGGTWVGVR